MGSVPAMEAERVAELLKELDGWAAERAHHIGKDYRFKNYAQSLEFVNRVGALAEEQNHHPDIWFSWGKVRVEIHTHKINGLSESDFVLAAKIDRLPA